MTRVTLEEDVTLRNQTTLELNAPNLALHVTTDFFVIATHHVHEEPEWEVTTVLRRTETTQRSEAPLDTSPWDEQDAEDNRYFAIVRRVLPGQGATSTAATSAPLPSLAQINACANTFWLDAHSIRHITTGGATTIRLHHNEKHTNHLIHKTRLVLEIADSSRLISTGALLPSLTVRLEGASTAQIYNSRFGTCTLVELAHMSQLTVEGYTVRNGEKGRIVVSKESNSSASWSHCPLYHQHVYKCASTGTQAYKVHMRKIRRHIAWSKENPPPVHTRTRGNSMKRRSRGTKRSRDGARTPTIDKPQPCRRHHE